MLPFWKIGQLLEVKDKLDKRIKDLPYTVFIDLSSTQGGMFITQSDYTEPVKSASGFSCCRSVCPGLHCYVENCIPCPLLKNWPKRIHQYSDKLYLLSHSPFPHSVIWSKQFLTHVSNSYVYAATRRLRIRKQLSYENKCHTKCDCSLVLQNPSLCALIYWVNVLNMIMVTL